MADITDTLKNILGDDAEDKIKDVMGSLSVPNDDGMAQLSQLNQLRGMIDGLAMNRSDPRANLLMALKPYMRDGRKQSVDSAVKMLGMLNIIKLLGNESR